MMTIMMMIMTDPFTTNLVVKGTVVKGSVVRGAHPTFIIAIIIIIIRLTHDQRVKLKDSMARAERVFRVQKNVW